MRRWAAPALLLLSIDALKPVLAADRGPVCREPSVVDEMTREVRVWHYYGSVDPELIIEQPTADPRVIRCQVVVRSEPYDMRQFGDHPMDQCLAFGFEVRILPAGFVVRDLR